MRLLASAIQLLLLLPFITVGSVPYQSPGSEPTPGSIEGCITLAGKPMSGVTVTLAPSTGQRNEPLARSATDETGRFRFDGVAPGKYLVDAFAPAFVAADASLSNLARGKAVTVSEGETVTGIEIALRRGGVITGRVVSSNRQPMIDMLVDLGQLDQNNRRLPRRVTASDHFMYRTDDRGIYRIYGLPAGRYKISVGVPTGAGAIAYPGGYHPLTFYPSVADESKAEIINVDEGGEVNNVDITVGSFARSYDVSGRIVDGTTGKPMAGLLYGYGAVSDSGQYIGTVGTAGVRSSQSGEFLIAGVPPGRYAMFAINEGNSEFYCEPAVFDITSSDVSGIEIKMKRGASISGTIAFEGIDDASALTGFTSLNIRIIITPSALEAFRRDPVRITPDGRFYKTGLRPGKAVISVSGSIGGKNVILSRIECDGVEQEAIDLRAGEQVTGVRLVLSY